MRRSLLLLLVLTVCAANLFAAQTHRKSHKPKPKAVATQPQPVQAAPVPQQPLPPPTPENGPSSPPEVSFRGGQLTITARNSTMSDVLNAVRQKTGASVDITTSSNERVVGKFGPGAPREVMAQLLNGSHYDYVLLGSPGNPDALNKIVLMARAVGPEPPAPQQPTGFRQQQQALQAVPQVEVDQNNDNGSADVVPEQNPPEEEPQEQQEQPEQPEQGQPGQNGPMVKTPEQLLRELQQQQQQQQQMQNGQPGPPER